MSSTTSTSATSAAASLITIQTFSGQSTYSTDFQNILNKSVQAQEIPLDATVDQVDSDTSRQSALQTIDTDLTTLQTAVGSLATAAGSGAITATVSDSSVASATVNGASAGTYELEVDSLGAATQAVSTGSPATVSDPTSSNLSTSSSYTLTVNGTAYTIGTGSSSDIQMSSNTLDSLESAINANSSTLGVSASLVNVGSSGSPDYRLAIQSNTLAANTIQLSDGSNDLLDTVQPGSSASYKVDGLTTSISSDSDTITLAPGLTVNLLSTTTSDNPVTITVTQSTASAETALQNLATAYNQVVTDLAAQHGQTAGALSGESILLVAQQALSSITTYTRTSGGVSHSLSDLGLSLNDSGDLSFDATQFSQRLGSNFTSLSAFLGDTTDGFIGNATNALLSLEDPTTGAVKTEESSISSDLTTLNTTITSEEAAINSFQNSLLLQLSHSDAAIATLQSQNTFFTQLFATENANQNAG